MDSQLVYRYVNQPYADFCNLPKTEIIGRNIENLDSEEKAHITTDSAQQALLGTAVQLEQEVVVAGRQRFLHNKYQPDFDSEGKVAGFFLYCHDITSIKSVQGELERAQHGLDMAVQASQFGIWETDPARCDWFFTDHVEQLWGLKTGSLENSTRKFDSRIHPQDYPRILEVRRLIEQEKTDHTVQFRALTNTGYRWMQAATHSQFDEQGNLTRRTGSITEIDQIKADQIKSADEVEQRDLFLAMLSHELRNPMTAIYHAIYYAQETGELPESLTEIFDIIDRQSKQMTELMDALLEVSRFNQEKGDFTFTQVDLGQTLEELVTELATKGDPENQPIVLKPINGTFWVSADQDRLNQAIVNLLGHAKKYATEKDSIEISIGRQDEKVTCSISDGRTGIPGKHQVDVFDQLIRDDHDAYRSIGGLSIDLFLARCIIRELGGNISIENEGLGKGSAFTFWLPDSTPTDKTINAEKAES